MVSPVNSINTNDLLAFKKLLEANPGHYIFTDKINQYFPKKEKNGFANKYGSSLIDGFRFTPETLFTAENEKNPTEIYNILLNNKDPGLNTEMRFAVLSFLIEVKYLDILNAALSFLEKITKEEELEIIKKYVHISIPTLKTEDECQKLCKLLEHNNPLLNDKKTGRLLLKHLGNKPPHLWAYFVNKGLSLIGRIPKNPLPEYLIASSPESVSSNKHFEFAIAKIMHALPIEYWDDFAKELIEHKNIDFDFKEILNEFDKQWLPGDDNKKIKILIKLTSGIWNYKDKALRIQILSMIDDHLINGLNNEQNNYIWSRGKGEILKKVVNSSGSLLGVLGIRDNSEDLENQVLDIIGHEPPFIASDITQIANGLINHIYINPTSSEALKMRVLNLHKIILESDVISDEEKGSTVSILGENILSFNSDNIKSDILLLLKKHINKASEISAWQALQWIANMITYLNTDNQNKAVELLEKYCEENPKRFGDKYIDAYTDCHNAITTVNASRTSDTITSSTVDTSTPFSKNENISFFSKALLQASTALQNAWKWFLKRLPAAFRVHIF